MAIYTIPLPTIPLPTPPVPGTTTTNTTPGTTVTTTPAPSASAIWKQIPWWVKALGVLALGFGGYTYLTRRR